MELKNLKAIMTAGQNTINQNQIAQMASDPRMQNPETFKPKLALLYADKVSSNRISNENGLVGNAKAINPEVMALEKKVADTETKLAAMSEEMAKQTELMKEMLAKLASKK